MSRRKPAVTRPPRGSTAAPAAARTAGPPRPASRRTWAGRAALAVLAPVLVVGLTELGLRAAGYGYPTGFFVPLPGGGGFVTNHCFAWGFADRAVAPEPLPAVLPAAKPPGTRRIFILGEDAALGWPEPAYGFGRVLDVVLRHRHPGAHFEIVNCAVTALNSHAVRLIAADCARLQPDLFIVYTGHNEFIGPRGPATALHSHAPRLAVIRASAWAKSLRVGQLAEALLRPSRVTGPTVWPGENEVASFRVPPDDARRQSVYDHFQANLADVIAAGRGAGARVLVGTVGTNVEDCPPFASAHRAGLSAAEKSQWEAAYAAGVALEAGGRVAEAVEKFRAAEQIDDRHAELHYRLARCYIGQNQADEAKRHFTLAREVDALPVRADARVNELIRQLAAGREAEAVYFADVDDALARDGRSAHGLPGAALFWDHCHLRSAGHYIAARALLPPVEAALGLSAPEATTLSEEQCAERLAETPFDKHRVAEAVLMMTARPPFTGQLGRDQRQGGQIRALTGMAVSRPELVRSAKTYAAAVANRPDDWLLRANYAALLVAAGRAPDAEEQLTAVARLLPGSLVADEALATVLLETGRAEEAVDRYRQILAAAPTWARAHNGLGDALATLGKFEEAAAAYGAALRLVPAYTGALTGQGKARLARDDTAGARADFEAALRLGPDPEAAYQLGSILLKERKPADALAHFVRAARIRPADARLQNDCGVALLTLGRAGEAAERFRTAVELNPNQSQAHDALAGIDTARGRHAKAAVHRRRAAERAYDRPGNLEALADFLANYGLALLVQGDKAGARACFQSTLAFTVNAEAEHQLGTMLLNEGKPAEALPRIQRACLLKPADARPQNNCGAALLALGKADEAAEYFRAAVTLDPNLAPAHVALAQIHMAKHRHADAIAHYRRAIELGNDQPVVASPLAWLLATAPDPRLRDGALAVRLAEQACRGTARRNVNCLDALTAAYAEVGRFADAVAVAREALALAESTGAAEAAAIIRRRLPALEAHRPLHP